MSDTLLEHRLVRRYLRDLDRYGAGLPAARARELHQEIAAHLEDVLPPDAPDPDVRAELGRLGPPRSLAAEAAGPVGSPAALRTLRRLRYRLGRVRWWGWAIVVIVVPALGTGTGFLVSMETATPLYTSGAGWLGAGYTWLSDIPLRVHVGTVTRTEDIQLPANYALMGPSHGKCT